MASCLLNLPLFPVCTKLIWLLNIKKIYNIKKKIPVKQMCTCRIYCSVNSRNCFHNWCLYKRISISADIRDYRKRNSHVIAKKWPHTKRHFYKTESRHDIISVVQSKPLFFKHVCPNTKFLTVLKFYQSMLQ